MIWAGLIVGMAWSMVGPSTPRYPRATEVRQFDFRLSPQGDFNQPEGWVRFRGRGYPFYIAAELTAEEFAVGGRSLCVRLNGGDCAFLSPPIEVTSDFNYVLQGQIKTKGLLQDQALILMEFLDSQGNIVGTTPTSNRVGGESDWTVVRVGPCPAPDSARTCRIGCVTKAGSVPDLSGKVYFDDLWLGRLPRLEVETSGKYRLFDVEGQKQAKVLVRGDEGRDLQAKFELMDADGKLVAQESLAVVRSKSIGTVEWSIPAAQAGFYHLDVSLEEGGRQVLRREFPITVLPALRGNATGEFGLSLPSSSRGLDFFEHLQLYSGSRWLKLPLWGPNVPVRAPADERGLAEYLERASRRGFLTVGRLDGPPADLHDQLADHEAGMADLVSMPANVWSGALESLLVRYSLKIFHWQLGGDLDRGFQQFADVDRYLSAVQAEASRIGRDIRLGLPWDLLTPLPASRNLSFLSLGDQAETSNHETQPPPLTDEQLLAQMAAIRQSMMSGGLRPTELFVSITPLPEAVYDRTSRVIDLARRAVAAKTAGASAIFLTDTGRPGESITDDEGAPNELFMIWRNLAENLGGMTYLGSLKELVGVTNHLFIGDGRATLVAWSEEPREVEAVLGRSAVVRDLWGRQIEPPAESETRRFRVDETPILITDVDEFLIRWQFGVAFAKGSVPGRFGAHQEQLVVTNPLDVPVSGSAAPLFPPEWGQRPEQIALSVLPKETARETVTITLPQGVSQGDYSIPIDFRISAERTYQFRVFRSFRVGGDELRIEAKGRALPSGSYEVDTTITNLTDRPMALSASARTLARPAELEFIPSLPAGATSGVRFLFADAAGLTGQKIRIKFEDPRNRREFSYDHFVP